jgi:hypothetical protein
MVKVGPAAVAVPDFTVTGEPAFAGTTTVNDVVVAPVTVADAVPNVTVLLAGVVLNAVPVMTTVEPTGAEAGEMAVTAKMGTTGAGVSLFLQADTTTNRPIARVAICGQAVWKLTLFTFIALLFLVSDWIRLVYIKE